MTFYVRTVNFPLSTSSPEMFNLDDSVRGNDCIEYADVILVSLKV